MIVFLPEPDAPTRKTKFSPLVYTQTRLVHRPGPVFVNHGGFTHSIRITGNPSSVPTQKACNALD